MPHDYISPKKLIVKEPFSSLFPIKDVVRKAILEDMTKYGFDESKPIDVWNGIVIDGHTRLSCALELYIKKIPIYVHEEFDSEDIALEYAIHSQASRRSLTDSELLRCIEELDKRKTKAEAGSMKGKKQASPDASFSEGKSAKRTAELVGTSQGKVERARKVLDDADEDTKEKVKSGKISINKAYNETVSKKGTYEEGNYIYKKVDDDMYDLYVATPKSKKFFAELAPNPDGKGSFLDTIAGCAGTCDHCRIKEVNPTFYPAHINAPSNIKPKGSKLTSKLIYLNYGGEWMGKWVPQSWIDKTIAMAEDNKDWQFLTLTRYPKRLLKFKFPQNMWLGATILTQKDVEVVEGVFTEIKGRIRFANIEPMTSEITFNDMGVFDWVVIGAQYSPAKQPEWEWIRNVIAQATEYGVPIFIKPSVTVRAMEYPEI